MYTSCPECGTVFRISTTDLRAAEGFVRCGHCSATFNAVATLTDEPPPTVTLQQLVLPTEPEPEPEPEPGPEPESLPGFPPEPQAVAVPPELKAAATYVPLPVSDDTLEFDIPEDSWSNFFEAGIPAAAAPGAAVPAEGDAEIVLEPSGVPQSETKSHSEPHEAEPDQPEPDAPEDGRDVGAGLGSDTVDQAGLYRALSVETGLQLDDDADWQALLEEVRDEDAAPEPVYVISEDVSQELAEDLPLPDLTWDEPAAGNTLAPAPLPADFAPELAGASPEREPALIARPVTPVADRPFVWEPPAAPPADSGRHWGYTAGTVLAAVLLVTQVLHQQREELATNPTLTEPLQRTYAALGLPLWPAWDLRSYELRSSEAVADRSSPGALDVLGRIAVVGNDPVGLPLVRVTLRDRFGESLGSRVFEPAEYLGRNARPREPVKPGTLIPVEISLKDPGRDAQGFDVDVCIMSRRDGVTCRGDQGPFIR